MKVPVLAMNRELDRVREICESLELTPQCLKIPVISLNNLLSQNLNPTPVIFSP